MTDRPRPTKRSDARRAPVALAAGAFAIAAPVAYVIQRLYERSVSGPVDPLLVLREAHTAFYWRALTASWWAALVAMIVFAVARRRSVSEPATRWIAFGVIPLVLGLLALAWSQP